MRLASALCLISRAFLSVRNHHATAQAATKAAAPAKKVAAKKTAAKPVKKLGKIIFEFDGQQIDIKAIEKKAAKLGGDVYVVASEKKIFDAEGKSVDLF